MVGCSKLALCNIGKDEKFLAQSVHRFGAEAG